MFQGDNKLSMLFRGQVKIRQVICLSVILVLASL